MQLSHTGRHESVRLSHAGRHESDYSGAPSQRQVHLMGQLVYPTWAALSPSGEGSRHGRDGLGEGPRQAGQVFRCGVLDVCHVGIRAPVPHELNEEWGDAHAVGKSSPPTPEAVSREHRWVQADLAQAVSKGVHE
jgi:hypothetical protein